MATSIIKIYNSRYNEWAEGVRVALAFSGFTNLGSTADFMTDANGTAIIEHSATGNCTVYANGRKVDQFYAPGSLTITI